MTDVLDIDKNKLDLLKTMCEEAIVDMTKDTTFRMMYKATGHNDYLYMPNNEYAENVSVIGAKFLSRKNTAEGLNNNFCIFYVKQILSMKRRAIKVYFGFEFTQLYKTFDGEVYIITDNYKKIIYVQYSMMICIRGVC